MAKLNPFKFLQEVRQETNKVTWPSRKETGITTAMVFLFAALAAIFFLFADQLIRLVVTNLLDIESWLERLRRGDLTIIVIVLVLIVASWALWAFNRARK
jgi:preprotein translocase subunit SecE